MRISELDIPRPAIEFLEGEGYKKLYPPQAAAAKAGLTDGKSVLVSAPTASGKTLIAAIAMISHLSRNRGKAVYLSPLRALAAEKFAEFGKIGGIPLGRPVRVGVSTGDFEKAGRSLGNNDILVLTNERMDSLIRRRPDWMDEVGLVIADEIHLIGDRSRGPTLEMVLTKLRGLRSSPQVVALSATISNADEIAGWLDCTLVHSTWRPVPLSEGVYQDGEVAMGDGSRHEVAATGGGPAVDLAAESVAEGGQSLIFADTRARSASLAAKASAVIPEAKGADAAKLAAAAKKIISSGGETKLAKTLAELVEKGAAFHHAGLNQDCRSVVEEEFRSGRIRLLASTPTLAAGVNLPARRVVISSVMRYNSSSGMSEPISILEYKQLCGRAGRPQYDKSGEAIVVGGVNADEIFDRYIGGEPEPIRSAMVDDRALRIHVLSLVTTSPGIKEDDVTEFFLGTLGGQQSGESTVKFSVAVALRFLQEEGMLGRRGGRLAATKMGRLVSRLYMDPMTAVTLRDAVGEASPGRMHTLGFLHLVSECSEFMPRFALRQKDHEVAEMMLEAGRGELLRPVYSYECGRGLLALHRWIGESPEAKLAEDLKFESGDVHRMVESSGWLLRCIWEISKHQERPDLLGELDVLRSRVAYGIKAELVPLVSIKGIGRVRSRRLFRGGIKGPGDLAAVPVERLSRVEGIGATLANNIKSQLRKGG
ncbi:superfamily II helicase [Cenarchaeum symbiosum A]|uniref:ATP-dependent DNA helicase Hel308 n=1 Tax=Cenarchaeum symbiosum (strain A) TaxID=414004 RepID=A0RYB7_CENSY|nr:superfamily II helicase [Cenarchaeum symbiosum A]